MEEPNSRSFRCTARSVVTVRRAVSGSIVAVSGSRGPGSRWRSRYVTSTGGTSRYTRRAGRRGGGLRCVRPRRRAGPTGRRRFSSRRWTRRLATCGPSSPVEPWAAQRRRLGGSIGGRDGSGSPAPNGRRRLQRASSTYRYQSWCELEASSLGREGGAGEGLSSPFSSSGPGQRRTCVGCWSSVDERASAAGRGSRDKAESSSPCSGRQNARNRGTELELGEVQRLCLVLIPRRWST